MTNEYVPISLLTIEVKIRYVSGFWLLMSFLPGFSAWLYISNPYPYLHPVDQFISMTMLVPAVFVVLWSRFNRWYFMIPAMFFLAITTVLAIGHLYLSFNMNVLWLFCVFLAAMGLTYVSFAMYVYRNIRQ